MIKDFFVQRNFYDPNTGSLHITDKGWEDISNLADIVIASHFYSNSLEEKEELKSIGHLKALELLSAGTFDPTKSSIKNYLYTGMRNEMKNYCYKTAKAIPVDDEVMKINTDSVTFSHLMDEDSSAEEISLEDIEVCVGRDKTYVKLVGNRLMEMGFEVRGLKHSQDPIENKDRLEMMVCIVIWKHLERCRSFR